MTSNLALFGITLAIGAIPLAIKSMRRIRLYRQAQDWPKVPATITESSVREDTDGDGTSYLPEFSYRYSVSGREYRSSVHTEGLPFPSTEDAARQMVKKFAAGSTVQVAVNPTNPAVAVLDTGFPKPWYVLMVASIVAFVVGTSIALIDAIFEK
ncbi:DUF3592 domain-containing protein [Ideonella sp. B508-1]|uniref:DUF3592 domain-containing protein n=1 Tax=Ideonella sp. B508-1 TaxID=137716 RepID=UPI000A05A243|nr:DUF3592 domain-containing protein [Ideonella sp. B508-1]